MPEIITINDIHAPELEVYAKLTEAQLKKQSSLFIAESVKVIEYALDYGCEPVSILSERRHIEGVAKIVIERCKVPVYTAEAEVLKQLTGFELSRGVLCAMKRPELKKLDDVLRGARRVAVLEAIADPTNIGAVMRSAAALGIDAVLLDSSCCDPLYRRAVRVGMGTVFQIPWTRIDDISVLHDYGFKTAAMALTDKSVGIEDEALMAEKKLAIIIGNEGKGLKAETIDAADYTVKIPMYHGVDSLNAAAASAVAFWQLRAR